MNIRSVAPGMLVRMLQIHQVGRHSAKPLAMYDQIERLLDGPYLELFARAHKPGWDVWGNEAPEQAEAWQGELWSAAR